MQYKNRPPHIFLNDCYYFITARTVDKAKYFNSVKDKKILIGVIKKAQQKFKFELFAWVVLGNHYHLMIKIKEASTLPSIINNINANSARLLNIEDNKPGRKIWWNYWDHCIRDEADFWKHFNYIHHNPIKHSYAKKMEDYHFSSYNDYVKKYGREWMTSCFELYPIVDFTSQE